MTQIRGHSPTNCLFGGQVYAFLLARAQEGLHLMGGLTTLHLGTIVVTTRAGAVYELFLPPGLYFGLEIDELSGNRVNVPLCDAGGELCFVQFSLPGAEVYVSAESLRSALLTPAKVRPTHPAVIAEMQALLVRSFGDSSSAA